MSASGLWLLFGVASLSSQWLCIGKNVGKQPMSCKGYRGIVVFKPQSNTYGIEFLKRSSAATCDNCNQGRSRKPWKMPFPQGSLLCFPAVAFKTVVKALPSALCQFFFSLDAFKGSFQCQHMHCINRQAPLLTVSFCLIPTCFKLIHSSYVTVLFFSLSFIFPENFNTNK